MIGWRRAAVAAALASACSFTFVSQPPPPKPAAARPSCNAAAPLAPLMDTLLAAIFAVAYASGLGDVVECADHGEYYYGECADGAEMSLLFLPLTALFVGSAAKGWGAVDRCSSAESAYDRLHPER